MWALARCVREEAIAYCREVGQIRPGFVELLDRIAARNETVWLASGGFDFYIEALLGDLFHTGASTSVENSFSRFGRQYFNRTKFVGDRIEVEFPHHDISCEKCAVCKGNVCDLAKATGATVNFVGDGASDRCAIGRADRILAVRDSLLAKACEARGVSYTPFDRFDELP